MSGLHIQHKKGQEEENQNKNQEKMRLTPKQRRQLEEHSVHHTDRHLNYMKRKMRDGFSFKKAHEMAMDRVGK